jgi:hypothetical protein
VYQTPIPDYGRARRSRFKRFALIFIAVFVLYEVVKSRDRGPVTITLPDGSEVHINKDKTVPSDPAVLDVARRAAQTYVKKNYRTDGVLKGGVLRDPKHAVFMVQVGDGEQSRRFHIYFHIPPKKTHWEFEREADDGADHDADDS